MAAAVFKQDAAESELSYSVKTVAEPWSFLQDSGVVVGYSDLQSSRAKTAFKNDIVSSQSRDSSM